MNIRVLTRDQNYFIAQNVFFFWFFCSTELHCNTSDSLFQQVFEYICSGIVCMLLDLYCRASILSLPVVLSDELSNKAFHFSVIGVQTIFATENSICLNIHIVVPALQ